MRTRLLTLALAACVLPATAWAQADAEALRQAKALFFDRQYAEARAAWQGILDEGGSRDAQAALYWVARCSESLGESERALTEYGRYLAARPADRTLAEEAKTSRIALAVKLAKAGQSAQAKLARDGLADSNRTVLYFAALQLASLGPEQGKPAVPVWRMSAAGSKVAPGVCAEPTIINPAPRIPTTPRTHSAVCAVIWAYNVVSRLQPV